MERESTIPKTGIAVGDLGGYWVGIVGAGQRKLRNTVGGDVTLVTSQPVKGEPPDYVLGHIKAPKEGSQEECGEP